MRSRGISGAYKKLLEGLAARGYRLSATQLERWCYWRERGLIDPPVRYGAGRGTRSAFPDLERAVDQAAAVADTLAPRDRLDSVALRLQAQGRDLDPDDIKAAFISELELIEKKFRRDARKAETSDDPYDLASSAGWAAHRVLTRGKHAKLRREQGIKTNQRAWTVGGLILLGQPVNTFQIAEAIEGTGLGHIIALLPGLGAEAITAQLAALAPLASFDAILRLANTRPPDEVAAALRIAEVVARLVPVFDRDMLRVGIAIGVLLHGPIAPTDVSPEEVTHLLTTAAA